MPASEKDGKARAAKEAARAAEIKREQAAKAAANKAAKADEESRKQETANRIARAAAKANEDNKGREAKAAANRREQEAANREAKAAADRREQEAANRAAKAATEAAADRREQEAVNRAAKEATDRREQEAANREAKAAAEAAANRREQEAANRAAKADEDNRKQEAANREARAAAKAAADRREQEAANRAAADRREQEAANRANKANTPPVQSAPTKAAPVESAPIKSAPRDPGLIDRYKEAQKRIAGLQPGTEAYDRNLKILQDIGGQYGLNWQQYVPGKGTPPPGETPPPTTKPPTKSAPRDPRLMDRYKEAQKRITSLQPGTEAYDRNLKILQDIGGQYGLNWQQWVPGWEKGDPNPPPAGTIPPPEVTPPGELPPGGTPPGEMPPEQMPPGTAIPPGAAIPGSEIPGAETPEGSALGPPTPTYYNQQPIAKQDDLVGITSGQVLYDMAGDVTEFDPGSFDSQMDAAYDNVYNRFQRRNQEEFSRQNEEFSQMAANRGLDPNSGAYRGMYKQLADRQDNARQEAQSAATDAAYAVQRQGFEQYRAGQLMPGEVAGQFSGIYGQGFAQRSETARQTQSERYGMNLQQGSQASEAARQAQGERFGMDLQKQAQEAAAIANRKQYEYQRRLDKLNYDALLARQRIASAGGEDGPSAYDDELERQRREGASNGGGSSPMNDFTTGVVSGSGGALTQGLNKKTY